MTGIGEDSRTRKLSFLDNNHRFLREAAEKVRLASDDPDQWMSLIQSVALALKGIRPVRARPERFVLSRPTA